ncbi:hypothetical protein HZA40_05495, partial [Candidatus Peregrinibacteria bacterium]|nr:hypothetical protein [Candidatus Peregrinibacteria bacterium]
KLMDMSKMAVQSLSKEMRVGRGQDRFDLNVNGADVAVPLNFDNCDLQKSASTGQNRPQPCHAVSLTKKMELDEHSTFLFLKLKKKLGKNLSDKEFIKLILEEREKLEFPQKQGKITDKMASTEKLKSITGETFNEKQIMTAERGSSVKTITDDTFTEPRYVSAKRRRQAIQPTNGKCSYPNCNSPYTVLHHTDRYSESKNHDSVIPLCKAHHEFAHNNLIQNERQTSDQWRLALVQVTDQRADQDTDRLAKTEISQADILYRKYRRELL